MAGGADSCSRNRTGSRRGGGCGYASCGECAEPHSLASHYGSLWGYLTCSSFNFNKMDLVVKVAVKSDLGQVKRYEDQQ